MTDRSAEWAARRRAWEAERLEPALGRAPERRSRFSTIGDTTIERLYGPWSEPEADPLRDIGFPGEPPFTRGIHPTGYRSRLWTMRMFAGFGAAEDTNARFRSLLDAGQTGRRRILRHRKTYCLAIKDTSAYRSSRVYPRPYWQSLPGLIDLRSVRRNINYYATGFDGGVCFSGHKGRKKVLSVRIVRVGSDNHQQVKRVSFPN
jgi:hypothetical protein